MKDCIFERKFIEPTEKYICMSMSLFLIDNYIKHDKNNKEYNVTQSKKNLYLKNTLIKAKQLLTNYFPPNYYLRIYYDNSLETDTRFNNMINLFKKYNRIQLIKFTCEKFKSQDIGHIHLFGTIMRFHPLFDKESPNIKTCVFIDADTVYKPLYLQEISLFEKSDKLVMAFNGIYQLSFYIIDNMDDSILNNIHLPAGLTVIKKTDIFKYDYWDKYINNFYKQDDLKFIMNYLDFKRFGCPKNDTDYDKQSYSSFEYGVDEILLSFMVRKILTDTGNQDKLVLKIFRSTNNNFVLKRLNLFLEYNYNRNNRVFKLFLQECKFLNKITFDELKKHILKMKTNQLKSTLFNHLKNNKYYDYLYLQSSLKNIITNFDELIKNTLKHDMYKYIKD